MRGENVKKRIAVIGLRGIPATYGGIEKHCEELYPRLCKRGYQVTLYARSYYCDQKLRYYKGVRIKMLRIPNIRGLEAFIHSFMSTLLATFSKADIIHFHAQGPALFSIIPKLLTPYKQVCFTCHGIDKDRDKWGSIAKTILMLGELVSARFTDQRIMVSETLRRYYREKFNVDATYVPNGVTIYPPLPLAEDNRFGLHAKKYLLFVGRLVPEKAPDMLIRAFMGIRTDHKLVIVGDSAGTDKYVDELKELAAEDDRIVFASYVYGAELKQLYSNCFAYLSASKLEGLPLTVLEALAFGCPVVLSDIPPHIEILNQGEQVGYSFLTHNVDSCRQAIVNVLSSGEDILNRYRENAIRLTQEHFDWNEVTSRMQACLEYANPSGNGVITADLKAFPKRHEVV